MFLICLQSLSGSSGSIHEVRPQGTCFAVVFIDAWLSGTKKCINVKIAEIQQNQGVESPKLSGVIAVSSVQLCQFESSTISSL